MPEECKREGCSTPHHHGDGSWFDPEVSDEECCVFCGVYAPIRICEWCHRKMLDAIEQELRTEMVGVTKREGK